ncbi:MAG: hypothetical protein DDT40_00072 [candidate division WS2 bacterium]|uniref:SH3b domain-containing protein n=1 Tax=Psychracetigena formicireducens TaxID=2986056 RepID=A0A9E2BFX0_PSYF1|nr:hypothetical protein [Candidatus Psychracetigena formicireducens]MBT9144244.1 hypothetical protein [Candidatus Psychracetigena formicireducens]MBT9149906.1 hypothetical protein [Candidatus Psychracetigena formicireducens]
MKKKIYLLAILISVVGLLSVIGINDLLIAQTAPPGSSNDPIVTKSYVDAKFDELMREINLLKAQNRVFLQEIATLKNQIATLTTTPSTPTQTGTVTSSSLNMRSGSGTNFSVIRTLTLGTEFTVLRTEGVWLQIRLRDGRTGWVHSGFVRLSP